MLIHIALFIPVSALLYPRPSEAVLLRVHLFPGGYRVPQCRGSGTVQVALTVLANRLLPGYH